MQKPLMILAIVEALIQVQEEERFINQMRAPYGKRVTFLWCSSKDIRETGREKYETTVFVLPGDNIEFAGNRSWEDNLDTVQMAALVQPAQYAVVCHAV